MGVNGHDSHLYEQLKKTVKEYRNYRRAKRKIHYEFHKRVNEIYIERKDLQKYHREIRIGKPVIMLINLALCFSLFFFLGIKNLSIVFVAIITMSGIFEVIFLMNIEKKIIKPINQLRAGVEEISKGNYGVKIECEVTNEISILVGSFNEMSDKLKAGEKLKLEYEENRKTLIANISHDLKTPVTAIQGYSEIMLERENIPRENVEKYHRIIFNNAAYINKLIDDLFLFSRLDMQKLELRFERIGVKAFMKDLMEEFSFELEDRQIGFNYQDELVEEKYINADRKRINQIFKNIIGNAVKYGAEENTSIMVVLTSGGKYINIDVKDNGLGIPEDKLPFVFDRFYRVDYARTKDLMSTGLGLTIAKELVEAHGGEITVTSEEKVGTCFSITLPLV